MKVTPHLHSQVDTFLQDKQKVHDIMQLHSGPVHLLFPDIMDENITGFRRVFQKTGIEGKVFYAHKANKSQAFVKRALYADAGIEVASKQELVSALEGGFSPENIICGGPKNKAYVWLGVRQGCILSIDSLEELRMVRDLVSQKKPVQPLRILIRISDLQEKSQQFFGKVSKFGLSRAQLPEALTLFKEDAALTLLGFHFHIDVAQHVSSSISYLESVIDIMHQAYDEGFSPTVIDMGGGFRTRRVHDDREWALFMEMMKEKLVAGEKLPTWNNNTMGLVVDDTMVRGREKFMKWLLQPDYRELLSEILTHADSHGVTLAQKISDPMFTLYVEPGYASLSDCGITLVRVMGTKTLSSGEHLILVDANMYSFSLSANEWLTDPLLVSRSEEPESEYHAFIGGNLCRGIDLIMKREVTLSQKPREGDVLVFINTAAYYSDFEDTNTHLHPTGKKLVASKKQDKWHLQSEEVYHPFLD